MKDKSETVMAQLKTCLENITTGNSYNYTVKKVYRNTRSITAADSLWPVILIMDASLEYEHVGAGFSRITMVIPVTGYVNSDNPETDANYLGKDIRQAVLIDDNAPHKQYGWVGSPYITASDVAADSQEGTVDLEITYKYLEEDDE